MESRKEIPQITPTDSHRRIVRRLVRSERSASLATTLSRGNQAIPYASVVTYTADERAAPILLLSSLADHTQALMDDPRACLLVSQARGLPNPQTGPRVSLLGTMQKVERDDPRHPALQSHFLGRHPAASQYIGFGDFALWQMEVTEAHYVGGFARAVWLGNDWLSVAECASTIIDGGMEVLQGFDRDQQSAIAYAMVMTSGLDLSVEDCRWQVVAIDCDGVLLRDGEGNADVPVWLPFAESVSSTQELAECLGSLAQQGQRIAVEQALNRA